MGAGELIVNGERIEVANYLRFHRKRIRLTLEALRKLEASFWNTYERAGLSRIYDALGSLPAKSFKERFHRTIFIVAEKQQEVKELPCLPLCYEPSKQWEFIANADIERFED